MSKIYRLIWNATARLWQVAGELGRQGRKRTGGRRLVAAGSLYLLPLAALGGELPSGGTVVTGVGSIEQFDKHLSITQGSERLAIEWQQFNIGAGNRVSFNQPSASAIALNRVIGTDGSRIMGQLDANGRVFLINPNGVLFGKNAQVDVGGLVASTLDISNEDFAAGNYRFRGNGNNAAIINKGHITAADGGAVALLGGHVSNEGVISARLGSVALVAGEQVTLDFAGDGLLKVQIDEATRDALVENHQLIQADGGQVLMSAHAADALLQTVVNNTGVIEARTLENRNGKIVLLGGFEGGTVEVAGKLDASAPEGGDGGFIDTSGAHVQIHEGLEVTTLAVDGRTGDWLIDPTDLTISAGSAPQTDSGIGAATLSANLESSNITLQTVAEGSEAGNIYVNGEVSWDAATTLTLSAHGDIHINQNISATTGKLALEYGQADVAAGNTADYHVNARVNLSAGQNFSTRLGSDGDVLEYTVITELGAEGSTSGTDLQGMQGNLNGLYALGADINASATESWDGGAGFNPIGDYSNSNGFTGVFDGLGHLITGLTINRPSQDDVGLFGYTKGAWLRNIGLQRGRVVGRDSVGSLVGMNQGAISQSWASVAVNGASTVGGLVGWNRNAGGSGEINHGTINESYAVGPVSGNIMYVGGLVGYNAWQISNSYATGVVSGNEYVGGLVGENFGTITNTYATGAVSGSDSVGGLVGAAAYGDIAESYWNTETTGQTSSAGGGTGLTTAELIEALPAGFDPEVWGNAGNQTTPYLLGLSGNQVFNKNDLPSGTISASNRPVLYTVIQDVHQLQAMKDALGERYVLGNDIDASATVSWNAGAGFAPIKTFNGTLDGLGHTIQGLTIHRPSADGVGLFGATYSSAVFRNIRLEDINVTGRDQVGGLVGMSRAAIENVHTSGTVSGNRQVGGLVGAQAQNLSKITGSSSMADVSGTGDSIGGLVGTTDIAVLVTIQDSHAGGAVSGGSQVGGLVGWTNSPTISNAFATGAVSGGTKVGGLVGGLVVGAFGQSSISNAFATGAVSGGTEVGGLVGYSEGEIRDSYATGTVTGADKVGGLVGLSIKEIRDSHAAGTVTGKNQVGGLVGHAVWSSSISNSYATGDVTGEDMVGGLVGQSEADSASTASISNSHASGTVSGNEAVGGLVGWNEKLITDSTASGAVTGDSEVGGLVGTNAEHFSGVYGRIEKSSASGDVTGTGRAVGGLAGVNAGRIDDSYASGAVHGRTKVGGLVGWGTRASSDGELRVTGSYATGDVTGTDYDVGGLVGASSRMLISHSFATGAVSGASRVGGLVGLNSGPYYNGNRIEYSFATGTVSGTGNAIGGLVGSNDAYIYRSYAEGTVQGNGNVGGLVGEHRDDRRMLPEDVDPLGVIEQSFATGAVNGSGSNIGGLVGDNRAIIRQSYASGAVSGDSNVGGLVGQQAQLTSSLGMVEQSYASGAVSGGSNVGGLVGHDDGGAGVVESFWDQEATGQTTSVGGTGLSSAQMRELASFAGWSIDDQGGTDSVWRIYEGHTAPLLRAFLTPFEVDVAGVSSTYNGTNVHALSSEQLSYDAPTLALFTGDLAYRVSSRNVGSYSGGDLRLDGLYSNQLGYDIVLNDGRLTVDPASLTVTSTDVRKLYDGTTSAAGSAIVTAGTLFAGDTLSGGIFTFTDPNAGDNKTVTVSGVTVNDGNGGANYLVSHVDNTSSTIDKATLTVTAENQRAVYDGEIYKGSFTVDYDGFVASEDETVLAGSLIFGGDSQSARNAGDYSITVSGLTADNYDIHYVDGTLTIDPASLTVTSTDVRKLYDGTTSAAGSAIVTAGTLFAGDTLSGGIFTFTDPNAGDNKTVTVSGVTVNDGNGGANYLVSYVDNTSSTIDKAAATVTANSATVTYNGELQHVSGFTATGLVEGEDESVLTGVTSSGGSGKNVGSYIHTLSGVDSNYELTFIDGALTIDPAPLIISSRDVSKVYDGTTSAVGTAVAVAGTQLYGSDSLSGGSFAFTDPNAGDNKTVTVSDVTVGDGNGGANYTITYVDNTTSTINPRPVGVTANAQTKTYGDYDPELNFTVEEASSGRGLLAEDSLSGELRRAAGEDVGRYAITQGTLANSNYDISFSGAELNIDPRAITLAADLVSKIYGEADPTLSVRITGGSLGAEAVSDTLADVTGELSRAAGRDVGSYDVVLGDSAKAGNYLITFDADNKAFSITPRPVTVAAHNHNKTYGDFDPTLSYTVEAQSVGRGLLAGDSLNGELSRVAGEDVGTYAIGQGSLANSNYDISFSGAELSITPRPITITALDRSKIYGEADPTLSVQIAEGNLAFSDTLADVAGELSRAAGNNVGSYNVILGEGTKADNYRITFDADNKAFSITPRPITITALDRSKIYGEADPTLSVQIAEGNLAFSDTLADVAGELSRAAGNNVGSYNVILGEGTKAGNYRITFDADNKAFSITPRPITITAHNQSKIYGDSDPTLSYTTEAQSTGRGLVEGDTFSGNLSRDVGEDVNRYAITQGSLNNSNYDISFIGAELQIDPRAITLAAEAVSKIYGEADPTLSVRITGGSLGSQVVSDTLEDVTGKLSRAAGSDVGSYNVLLGEGAKADNYLITFDVDNQAFTITPRSIRVTADDQHKYQGEADPVFTWHYDASALVSGDKAETLFSGSLARAMGEEPGIYTINLGSLQSGSNYTIDFVPGELQIEAAGVVRRLGDRGKSYQDALVVALQSAAQAGPGPASNICFELTASSEPDDSDCSDYPVTGFAFGMSQASDGISAVQGLYSIVNGGLRLPEGFDEQ